MVMAKFPFQMRQTLSQLKQFFFIILMFYIPKKKIPGFHRVFVLLPDGP